MNNPDNVDDEHSSEPSEPGRPRSRVPGSTSATTLPSREVPTPLPDAQQGSLGDVKPRPLGVHGMAWTLSWLGIVAAGGFYGIVIETLHGGNEPSFCFFAGIAIAAIVSVPVIISIVVLAWTFWLSRHQTTLATLVGACTGILSSTPVAASIYRDDSIPMIILAGCLGGGGGGFPAFVYWGLHTKPLEYGAESASVWHYSLRDLFKRFTVLAILIAA